MKKIIVWTFISLALAAGIFVALFIKKYAASQLFALLDGEIKAAVPNCHLETGSIDVSPLAMTADARDASMICDGQRKLLVKHVTASFSLARIFDRRILLSELNLLDGEVEGVSPKSEAFRFIFYLAEPIAPERDTPDRWALKLIDMNVRNTSFIERIGEMRMSGEGGYLEFRKASDDTVSLRPGFSKLTLAKPGSKEMVIGEISAEIISGETSTLIESLRLMSERASAEIRGRYTDKTNQIEARASYEFDSSYLNAPDWLQFMLSGTAGINGEIDKPTVCGEIGGRLHVARPELSLAPFENLAAAYCTNLASKPVALDVMSLKASNEAISIEDKEPIRISEGRIQGAAQMKLKSLKLGEKQEVTDISAVIHLDGQLSSPAVSFDASVGTLALSENVSLTGLQGTGRLENSLLRVSARIEQDVGKGLFGEGAIALNEGDLPVLKDVRFRAVDLEFMTPAESVIVNLSGSIEGPAALNDLHARARGTVAAGPFAGDRILAVDGRLEKGGAALTVHDPQSLLKADISIPSLIEEKKANLKLSFTDEGLQGVVPENTCLKVKGNLQYEFLLKAPRKGNGSLFLPELSAGCDESRVAAEVPATLAVREGALVLQGLRLSSHGTSLLLDGQISPVKGFSVQASGSLGLESLLPLVPSLDDLGGTVDVRLAVSGPLEKPLFNGAVAVVGGHFSHESSSIAGSSIHGTLDLEGENLVFSDFKGELNGGDFSVEGSWNVLDPAKSSVRLLFDDVVIESVENSIFMMNGNIGLSSHVEGKPLIEGAIEIQSGQYQKNIEIQGMVSLLTDFFFGSKNALEETAQTLPDIDIRLSLEGKRNIFMFTNYFGAEVGVGMNINGSLSHPQLNGRVETLKGWFGLRNRRFVITSGSLIFSPLSLEPQLDLVGETKLYSSTGNPVSVILEAKGPVTHPTIELSSDQGLSEQDIFALLATGQGATNPTFADTVGRELEESAGVTISSLLPFLPLPGVLDELTRIDSLSFEPELDPVSGLVQPVAIAEKDITDRMRAVGQIGLGQTNSMSRASLIYDLTPKLNIAGILDTGTVEQRTSLGVDLGYTVLSRFGRAVKIKVYGNKAFSTSELLRAIKLNESVSIRKGDVQGIANDIRDFYSKRGYRRADVQGECVEEGNYCGELKLHIKEGEPVLVTEVVFQDEDPKAVLGDKMPSIGTGGKATLQFLDESRSEIVRALRNEGYISARIEGRYEEGSAPDNVRLVFRSVVGKPVTFVFSGNTRFTAGDFLNTINFFKRRIPFGRNTVNLLVENIQLLYRRAGYLDVVISKTEEQDQTTGRISYFITIVEGKKVPVSSVTLEGNTQLSTNQIRSAAEEAGQRQFDDMFNPRYVVAENLKSNADFIKSFYVREGFPEVSVEPEVRRVDHGDEASIVYVVREGQSNQKDWLDVEGFPPDVELPKEPGSKYSKAKANEYIRELIRLLNEAAYFSPNLSSTLKKGEPMKLIVEAGSKTRVRAVRVEGARGISEKVIEENIVVHPGDTWNQRHINESKLKLLKLGLFSNVDVKEEPEGPDARTVVFQVREKPLQTLQFGAGANSEYGLHVFGEGSDRGLFKDGRVLSLRLDGYYDLVERDVSQGSANLRYLDPAFLNSNINFAEDLRYVKQNLTTQEFDLNRVSLSSSLYRVGTDRLTLSLGHTIMEENLENVTPDAVLSPLDMGLINLSSVGFTMRYDQRNSALSPTSGFLAAFDAAVSSRFIASDANYYIIGGRLSWLEPLRMFNERLVLGLASRLVSGWTYDGTTDIPISQRLYAGGRTTVRGFRENSLGPKGYQGAVIGGDVSSVSNLQLNYLFADDFSAHTFLDAGNVYLRQRGVDLGKLRYGTGIGFEYRSPIGPIGVDLGFPINTEAGDRAYRFYFTIGTIF